MKIFPYFLLGYEIFCEKFVGVWNFFGHLRDHKEHWNARKKSITEKTWTNVIANISSIWPKLLQKEWAALDQKCLTETEKFLKILLFLASERNVFIIFRRFRCFNSILGNKWMSKFIDFCLIALFSSGLQNWRLGPSQITKFCRRVCYHATNLCAKY